jgi:hypothetical protein
LLVADPCRTVVSTTTTVLVGVAVSVQVRYDVNLCEVKLTLAAEPTERLAPAASPMAIVARIPMRRVTAPP